jgi:uncharacterized protein YraI
MIPQEASTMINRSLALLVLLSGLFFTASAFAANGYTTGNVNMRTGPSVYYPRITVIPVGSPVIIYRCTQGQRWCSVRWHGYRGWVSRRYLRFGDYRPRIYAPPPDIYFDFDFREPRWRDRHDRWHKARPYPRRKKKIIRRKWNRDHDRWHKKQKRPKARPYLRRKKRIIRRDWNRDHDRWHRDNRAPGKRFYRRRNCPPGRDCD